MQLQPYIEVSQIVIAEWEPGNDITTYTQLTAGIDASINGRRNGGSLSLRVEQNVGYGGDTRDSTALSGVARGYTTIVPRQLTFEAGALATTTRVDEAGSSTLNPILGEDSRSDIYSIYAGPTLRGRSGDLHGRGVYRVGFTKVDAPDTLAAASGLQSAQLFDSSLSQSASVHVGTRPGEPLPVGIGVGAGWNQEDVDSLDQRVRDLHLRVDAQLPIASDLALVAGVGYEDVEVSGRDVLRDGRGDPIIGTDGLLIKDESQSRRLAYDVSGLIYDIGIIWRPSSRTNLNAHIGRRYDSLTYYGSFAWSPTRRQSVNIAVYDSVSGFGNRLNAVLANLPVAFTAGRNALTGDLSGCVGGGRGRQLLGRGARLLARIGVPLARRDRQLRACHRSAAGGRGAGL